ncbi:MAG: GNAT family N-acetyltransferase [Pseudorhodobacter sp.]|nr:GNAT family N-acetyltransferase [Pseudorhodobacter sp.]
MDPLTPRIQRDSPLAPEVLPLLQRHLDLMWASSPPESVHALAASDLADKEVAFFTLREAGAVLGMAALRQIDTRHAEIKSMHIVAEARGRGLARVLLNHVLAEARAMGYARLSLETGVEPVFAPARALYLKAGFAICRPFAGYNDDPNSVFMTRAL